MKKITKLFVFLTALVTFLFTITPTLNAKASSSTTSPIELEEVSGNELQLSTSEIEKFNEYIILNADQTYSVKETANLTKLEYIKLNSILTIANQEIKKLVEDPSIDQNFEIEIMNPLDETPSFATSKTYKEGVTKVTFHWWGVKIKISKTVANKGLYAGVTLAGIWLPSRVLASAGVILGLTSTGLYKGGIWIDQYWVPVWGPLKTLFGFNAVGYQ